MLRAEPGRTHFSCFIVKIVFPKSFFTIWRKLGCVVRMVVDPILPHAESGPNDHRKDAPPFSALGHDFLGKKQLFSFNKLRITMIRFMEQTLVQIQAICRLF